MRRPTLSKQARYVLRPALRLIVWPLQGLALTLFGACCRAMTPERAALFGAWLACALGPKFRWHRRLRDNLSVALPHATSERVEEIAQAVWHSFGATLAEGAPLKTIAERRLEDHVEVVLGPRLEACRRRAGPFIFVIAHLGNWEIAATTTLVPARLALKFGCPLVPVRVERLQPARLPVTMYDPVLPDAAAPPDVQVRQMTARVNALLETWIVARPQQWQCFQNRWPQSHPQSGAGGRGAAQRSPARANPRRLAGPARAAGTGGPLAARGRRRDVTVAPRRRALGGREPRRRPSCACGRYAVFRALT